HIQNQGGCGSCWAAASVSVMSDRLCISSNYTDQQMISLQDLVSCCDFCGDCARGNSLLAFLHLKKTGIVTGGSYSSNEGCRPYEIPSTCGVPCPAYFYKTRFNQQCDQNCNELYGKEYKNDLRKGNSFYLIHVIDGNVTGEVPKSISEAMPISAIDLIKREIMKHGPVVTSIDVSEPFAHFRSGVYTKCEFTDKGHENLNYGHWIRIIGWGSENGLDYWTIANSWGRQWGENGFGRLAVEDFDDHMIVVGGLW
ncbi:hypothetical protein PENTCL1PPCAC_7634, partial [Pristionchus entomophagus]